MARTTPPDRAAPVARLNVRGPLLLGLATSLAVFGGGLGGAALARIDRGVGLSGTIIVESKVKAVQHQRGGMVGDVHIAEGQDVAAGQLLVTLDTQAIDDQMTALRAQADAAARQLTLIRQEAQTMADLAEKKLAARSKVLGLERQVAEIEKETAGLQARISLAEQELQRAEIRSPTAGRVLSVAVYGRGAVIQPGGTVVEIVPQDDRLVIEGRLAPIHIETVKPGMEARVWLSQLSWRDSRPLPARLAWISPDSVEDKRTGSSHFVARIELESPRSEVARTHVLHPGQRAEILLRTGERSLLDQLLDPMVRNLHRAFRT
jgi:multidrug efflux pump subunit AcrA (membrane-fusion protein)